jgi:hypothetical protein
MKQVWALVTAAFLLIGSAIAQGPPDEAVIPPRSIRLTAEQGHIIKEVVLKDMHAGQGAKLTVAIGDKAPADIALENFPQLVVEKVPQLRAYKFFVADNQIVIVNANDNKVGDILK